MNVSEMQSALDQLRNGFNSHQVELSESQWAEIEKSLKILDCNIRKLQKGQDKKYKEDHRSFDPGLETGMEYVGDSELMDDIHSILRF